MKDLLQIFAFVVVGGCMFYVFMIGVKKFAEYPSPLKQPTVHAVYGVTDCEKAEDYRGTPISCAEAMKGGRYDTEWNAPNSLRTTE